MVLTWAFSTQEVTREITPGYPIHEDFPNFNELSITHDDSNLNIRFPDDMISLTRSFAGTEIDHSIRESTVRVRGDDITKLPHNLALSVLNMNYTEGMVQLPSGQTPDFVRIDDGIMIGELKTSASSNERALSMVLDQTEQKYGPQCDFLFLVGVNVNHVETRGILLSELAQEAMIKARRIGDMILDLLPPSLMSDRSGRDISQAFEHIRSIQFSERGLEKIPSCLWVTPQYMSEQLQHEATEALGSMGPRQPVKSIGEWLRSLPGTKTHFTAAVHVPCFLTQEDSEVSVSVPERECGNMHALWSRAIHERKHRSFPEPTVDEMRRDQRLRDMNGWGKASMKDLRNEPDNHDFLLSRQFRIELAVRGLGAKAFSDEAEELRRPKRLEDKTGYSPTLNTSAIDEWVTSPLVRTHRGIPLSTEDFWLDDGEWAMGSLSEMWGTDMLRAFENTELVLREVIYNCKRNQLPSNISMGMVLRKVPGRPIYVLIRPTRGDGPIFYSVLFKGCEYAPGIFEDTKMFDSCWRYTDFISMDQDRLSHLVNLPSQVMSLWSLLADTLSMTGLEPGRTDSLWEKQVTHSIKALSLILIEDKEDTSTTLQLFRYYYMKVFSSVPPEMYPKEEIVSKLPDVIRSPVLMWVMRRWHLADLEINSRSTKASYLKVAPQTPVTCCYCRSKHKGEECQTVEYKEAERKEEASDDEEETVIDDTERLFDPLPHVPSPFGFIIDSSEKFLLSCYVCMLHNKDEGSDHVGSIKAFSKLAKMEDVLRGKLEVESWRPETNLPRDFYEFDPRFIKMGADLIKEDLRSRSALSDRDNYRLSSLGTFASTTLESFATTKSSTTSIFTGNAKNVLQKTVEGLMAIRTKCFAALYSMLPLLMGVMLMESLGCLYNSEELFKGYIIVSIFRKYQIGGVREISILDMASRLRLAALESISTGICIDLEEECLTKPKEKKKFVSRHTKKVKANYSPNDCLTIKMSMDMTTWCQCFLMKMFACLLSHLTPAEFFPFISRTLNTMSNKRVEMPKTVFREFMKGESSTMVDKVILKLRQVFWGFEKAPQMKEGSTYVTLHGNMLQGILHYTSSLYHVAMLHVFKKFVEKEIISIGFTPVTSFQVSSDDEGILITLCPGKHSPRSNPILVNRVLERVRIIKDSVDAKFGLRTSWEKSTVVISPLYEFNSIFFVGNTITSPLIKFVCRANDDPPEDNLHKRVANMTSSLGAIREAGGTGALCSLVSACQVISLQRNLGKGTMSWWNSDCEEVLRLGLSVTGSLKAFSPKAAGLVDLQLLNYSSLPDEPSKQSAFVRLFQLYSDLIEDDLPLVRTEFRMWNQEKHKKLLERLGIEKGDLTKEDLRLMMNKPQDSFELRRRLEINVSKPSIARSFMFPKRSETVRVSPYLFWSGCIRKEGVEGRLSLIELLRETEPEESFKYHFINSGNYDDIISFCRRPMTFTRVEPSKMRERTLRSYKPRENDLLMAKPVISRVWFGTRGVSATQSDMMFPAFLQMIPWLEPTFEETVERPEFQGSVSSLLSAIESLQVSKGARTYLCRPAPSHSIALESMPRRNSFRQYAVSQGQADPQERREGAIDQLRKIGRLVILMQASDRKEHKVRLAGKCAEIMMTPLPDPDWGRKDFQNVMLSASKIIRSSGFVDPFLVIEHLKETRDAFWVVPQRFAVNGNRMGHGESYQYTISNGWVRTVLEGEKIVKIERERGKGDGLQKASQVNESLQTKLAENLIGLLPHVVATPHAFRIGLTSCERTENLRATVKRRKRITQVIDGVEYTRLRTMWGPKIPFSTMYREGISSPVGSQDLLSKWANSEPIFLQDFLSEVNDGGNGLACKQLIMNSVMPKLKNKLLEPLPNLVDNEIYDEELVMSMLELTSGDEDSDTSIGSLADYYSADPIGGFGMDDWDEGIPAEEGGSYGIDTQMSLIMNVILRRVKEERWWTLKGFEQEILTLRAVIDQETGPQPNVPVEEPSRAQSLSMAFQEEYEDGKIQLDYDMEEIEDEEMNERFARLHDSWGDGAHDGELKNVSFGQEGGLGSTSEGAATAGSRFRFR